jgi:hypothetical protein
MCSLSFQQLSRRARYGCFILTIMLASSTTSVMLCALSSSARFRIILIATSSPLLRRRPKNTLPNEPVPSSRRSSNIESIFGLAREEAGGPIGGLLLKW